MSGKNFYYRHRRSGRYVIVRDVIDWSGETRIEWESVTGTKAKGAPLSSYFNKVYELVPSPQCVHGEWDWKVRCLTCITTGYQPRYLTPEAHLKGEMRERVEPHFHEMADGTQWGPCVGIHKNLPDPLEQVVSVARAGEFAKALDPYVSSYDNGDGRYFVLADDEGNAIPGSALNLVRCGVCSSAVFDLDEHKRWHEKINGSITSAASTADPRLWSN